jgi:hypothetical protein
MTHTRRIPSTLPVLFVALYGGCTADTIPSAKAPYEAPVLSEDGADDSFTRRTQILGSLDFRDDTAAGGVLPAAGYHGYVFTADAGSTVSIDAWVTRGDSVALLYGPKGRASWGRARAIAPNDDSPVGGTLNSHIEHAIEDAGTYLVVVTDYFRRSGLRYGVSLGCADGSCTVLCLDGTCPRGASCRAPECGPTERCARVCDADDPTRACEADEDCGTVNTSCCCPRYEAANVDYLDDLSPECGHDVICPAVMCAAPRSVEAACVENRCALQEVPNACELAGGDCRPGFVSGCGPGMEPSALGCGAVFIETTCCVPVEEPEPRFCGGIAGFPCPEGLACVDDPRDSCDPAHGGADCSGICVEPEPEPRCVVGGCSGQICTEEGGPGIISTCEWIPEYACYDSATCARQPSGDCGWTQTDELRECIERSRDCRTTGCAEGRWCSYCWGHYACIPDGALC